MDENELENEAKEVEDSPYHTSTTEETSSENNENPSVFGIITKPSEELEKIKHRPKSLVAILIVTLITFVGAIFSFINFRLPADLIAELGGEGTEFVLLVSKVTLILAGLIGPIFGILLSTVIYFIVVKIMKSEVTFRQTFSMFSHISIITAIGALVQGFMMLVVPTLSPETLVTSLGSIISIHPIFDVVLNSIEIFSIWQLIVTAIGLQIVAKISKRASWSIVIIIFFIGLILQIISAAINMALA